MHAVCSDLSCVFLRSNLLYSRIRILMFVWGSQSQWEVSRRYEAHAAKDEALTLPRTEVDTAKECNAHTAKD